MCRIILAILIALFCYGPRPAAVAQTRRTDSPDVLKQLLALPAPTPRHAGTLTPEATERQAEFFARANPPADDAPIEDLVEYWARAVYDLHGRHLTDAVKQRLLDHCLSEPQVLPQLLNLLPKTDAVRTRIKELYDNDVKDERLGEEWRRDVKDWLVLNSAYFLDELIEMAQKAKDEKDGDVKNEEALGALAKQNWSAAEPMLRGLMASGQPLSNAVALSLFYRHAIDEKDLSGEERYRRDLQAIAANRNLPPYARHTAIVTVSTSEWSGRDEWYIGLFQDQSLRELRDGNNTVSYAPLLPLYNSDLDKWTPVVARLLKSDDINVRTAAADCLMMFPATDARKDVLLALVPWLSNEAWLKEMPGHRLRFIQTLGEVDVPESVPGLITLVDSDQSDNGWQRAYAAKSLARYKDPRAVPALKKILALEKDESLRQQILEGLLGSGGLSTAEQLQAVEAYASKLTTEDGAREVTRNRSVSEEPLPLQLSIGRYLTILNDVPESLVNAVLVRAESLASENPPVAKELLEIVHEWQGSQIDLDMIRRVANGSADAKMIEKLLLRKSKLHESLRPELQGLAAISGVAQGLGAVLLDDALLADGILNSKDQAAKMGLLACSRLVQKPLPLALVGPLLNSKDPLLAFAAETYLLAEDSREARELLWRRHPNEAFITGWLETLDYPTDVYTGIRKTEGKLRAEILEENGPIEILAMISNDEHQSTVLRIYRDKAVYTEYEDSSRYRERTVPKAEVSALKDFITTSDIADRGPMLEWCHHDCATTEFLAITKEKGRRVFGQARLSFDELWTHFLPLGEGEGVKTHYKLEKEIKGLEVLYANDELTVNDVSQQGSELRVFVGRVPTDEEMELETVDYDALAEEEAAERLERRRREAEKEKARLSWRVWANNQLGAVTSQPDVYPVFDSVRFITDDEDESHPLEGTGRYLQVLTPDSVILAQDFGGLWKQIAGGKPVRIADGLFASPIVTRDRKWIVLASTDENWSTPNHIVRFNLQTGRLYRVNLEPADDFHPVAFVASHNKVLLRRSKGPYAQIGKTGVGPERPEYYLLDASTGESRLVTGEFEPLQQTGNRTLQRTDKPDEFWAAVPDNEKNKTRVGRYNTKDFSFKPVMEIPHIAFDSMGMWVDATAAKIYVVYKGQLLRLPLQATPK